MVRLWFVVVASLHPVILIITVLVLKIILIALRAKNCLYNKSLQYKSSAVLQYALVSFFFNPCSKSVMFLRRNTRWPKQFGFEIAGLGPCFVTLVEKDSVAFSSGLQPGDQILELDNQDVTNMSAKAIRTLAKHSRSQPPTLGVVSRGVQTNIMGSKLMGLGFAVSDTRPVVVEFVDKGGPAEAAGIKKGSSFFLSFFLSTFHVKSSTHLGVGEKEREKYYVTAFCIISERSVTYTYMASKI